MLCSVWNVCLFHTEHGWAHGSHTVYSVIEGLTGTSIGLQPCLGISWYELDSNVTRVCTNKARIYSVKQCLSRFEHDLHTSFLRLFNGSKYGLVRSCTIKHDFYSTFTGFTYGPTDFCPSYSLLHIRVCRVWPYMTMYDSYLFRLIYLRAIAKQVIAT